MVNTKTIMQECMVTDNPLVSILMAVYNPNKKWLLEQLDSLDRQTYPNLELLIYDDCPEHRLDENTVKEHITAFPYRIIRGEKNLGSNKAFERLTAEGQGKYFSYCDQDDVWHSDKIRRMVDVLEQTGSPLVCSDLEIIDEDGKHIADSITKIRKRHVFREGNNLAGYLLIKNFVTGCAMMIKSDVAKKSMPFLDSVIHDQWLAINAALAGRIEVIHTPLIDYRQHGGNQTSILHGVNNKQTYFLERIKAYRVRIEDYRERIYCDELMQTIDNLVDFYDARIRYYNKPSFHDLRTMMKYFRIAPDSVLIESVMWALPERLFKKILDLAKKGKI